MIKIIKNAAKGIADQTVKRKATSYDGRNETMLLIDKQFYRFHPHFRGDAMTILRIG